MYLDEKENPEIVEMVDYIDKGNIMQFKLLFDWKREVDTIKRDIRPIHPTYNLGSLLQEVYKLLNELPPLTVTELFGNESQPAMQN